MRGWNHLLPVIVPTAVAPGFHQQPGYPAIASTAGASDERPLRTGGFAVIASLRAITARDIAAWWIYRTIKGIGGKHLTRDTKCLVFDSASG